MALYRLDRTQFKAHTAAEADKYASSYKKTSWKERCRIAAYLNSIAYNYHNAPTPEMDKTKFKATARNS